MADLARHDSVDNGKSKPLFTEKQWNGRELEVYDAAPLLSAGVELFGTEQNRRYHPIPGAHTICANKGVVAYRPKTDRPLKEGEGYGVWSFIAISLSADRDFAADLFIEDAGGTGERQRRGHDRVPRAASQLSFIRRRCGRDQNVLVRPAPTWASLTA